MKGWLIKRFWCLVGSHEWTCKAREGIEPTTQELASAFAVGFKSYSAMYCKHCGKVSKLSF